MFFSIEVWVVATVIGFDVILEDSKMENTSFSKPNQPIYTNYIGLYTLFLNLPLGLKQPLESPDRLQNPQ